MFNLPVKLSAMSAAYTPLSPQVFLDRSPQESIRIYKSTMPQAALNTLEFAFSDAAILLILEREFEVRVARREMVFLKPALDPESWLLANGLTNLPPIPVPDEVLETLTEALWNETGKTTTWRTTVDDRVRQRREIKTLLVLYWHQYGRQNPHCLHHLRKPDGFKAFFNMVVTQAMYKADGAAVMFGRKSAYCQLWHEVQARYYAYTLGMSQGPYRNTA